MKKSLGGERLGSGNKRDIEMHNYQRSNHDLTEKWKSTMASGTVVPFLSKVGLPGDTWDIDLEADALTHPTIGPLFGSYKLQLDVFEVPMRLFQPMLAMNNQGMGLRMGEVMIPQVELVANNIDWTKDPDNQQIGSSSIFKYLGISGLGYHSNNDPAYQVRRRFNVIPWLSYWEIIFNFFTNKQEGVGGVIHKSIEFTEANITEAYMALQTLPLDVEEDAVQCQFNWATNIAVTFDENPIDFDPRAVKMRVYRQGANPEGPFVTVTGEEVFEYWAYDAPNERWIGSGPKTQYENSNVWWGLIYYDWEEDENFDVEPKVTFFDLKGIESMRMLCTSQQLDFGNQLVLNTEGSEEAPPPYRFALEQSSEVGQVRRFSKMYSQEGLAVKTYQSDLYNNWVSTEWIDGDNGIKEVTSVIVADDKFTIDELNLKNKLYNMMMRIGVSGGTYHDWIDVVFTDSARKTATTPIYSGGLSKEIIFEAITSTAQSTEQPLGTLAGRGRVSGKHKGGKIVIKCDEPCYIMGVVSITPRIDYSQGNTFDVNLNSINDLHKPAMDEIGYQDVIVDNMASFSTQITSPTAKIFKSAGKQPAWSEYMSSVDKVYGNFAEKTQQMWMTLARRYEADVENKGVLDLTTYIDPVKFNHVFADTRRDAMNFWIQIDSKIEVRRLMSAKLMPNL